MKKWIYFGLILVVLNYCKKNPTDLIAEWNQKGDFLQSSLHCIELRLNEHEECKKAFLETEKIINSILSEKASLPTVKIIVQQEKKERIEKIISINSALSIKYQRIWKETVE